MSEEKPVARPIGIAKIFEAVKTIVEDVTRENGESVPSMFLGADMEAQANSTPSILWVLLGGPVSPPRQTGADGVHGVKQIGDRHERILVKIWAEDFGKTERLMNHFVAACRGGPTRPGLTGYSFNAISTDWTEGQTARSGLGRLCKLEIELRMPFTSEPLAVIPRPQHLNVHTTIPAQ